MRENALPYTATREIISESEADEIFAAWNATGTEYPEEKCIQDYFTEQVRRSPEHTAVIFKGKSLTYRELNARAEALAEVLSKLGARAEVIVAACVPRSVDLIVALLAILKTGAAYLPLDPEFPDERLQLMLSDSGTPILITQKSLADRFSNALVQMLFTDQDLPDLDLNREPSQRSRAQGSNLAYVIYTSGSSGVPKGVMIEHRNVSNFFVAMDEFVGGGPGVWLAVTSISFDISVLELFWTLARGFTIVLQSDVDKLALNGEYTIHRLIERYQVTHFQCTPSLIRWLSESGNLRDALRSIKRLVVGGEPFPSSLAVMLTASVSGVVLNAYGPTETTVWSAIYRLQSSEQTVPIGKPIANTEMYVLDEDLRRVPIGAQGELFIGGAGVVRGYLNRPELTAEKFLVNPFDPRPGARFYRTGDVVRYRPNGELEFLGRVDNQVKIHGFRIELEEIESHLQKHPRVGNCAVIAKSERSGEQTLLAYITGADQTVVPPSELHAFLETMIPSHMIPSAFFYIDSMPFTPNGKVDRRALKTVRTPTVASAHHLQNASKLEEVVASIWCEALNAQTVDHQKNFIDLGANSMSFVEVVTRLREQLRISVTLPELFEHSTVELLARHLNGTIEGGTSGADGTLRGQSRREALLRRGKSKPGRSE
jgi:amino acid adenylation domain-containing protein